MDAQRQRDPRPVSAVTGAVGFVGLAGLGVWAMVARHFGLDGPYAALIGVLACAIAMVLWSLLVDKVHRRPSTGIDWVNPPRSWHEALGTGLVKLAGLWATWGVIAFVYCVGRWYWQGSYLFAMHTLQVTLPFLLIFSVPYVLWLDRRLIDPHDGAWAFGRWLLGGMDGRDPALHAKIIDHARAWTIKGFFTAFMLSTLPSNWLMMMRADPAQMLASPVMLADGLVAVMFLIDVTQATVGYLFTMRPLDSHIRSGNPFAAGWMAALICYPPFVMMNPGGPLDYGPGQLGWARAFSDHPLLQPLWAFLLVGLTAIYAWATIAFGPRFSNLTHRGIITHGPYRWSKHPAYLSKNLFWWAFTVPILTSSGLWTDAFRNCAILAIVNGVYFWRAKTEEWHLMADPAYREYADWMARNMTVTRLLAWIGGGERRRPAPLAAPAE